MSGRMLARMFVKILALGLQLYSTNCECAAATARPHGPHGETSSGAALRAAESAMPAEHRSRLVRSHASISSAAVVQAEEAAMLDSRYPHKPRVVQIFYETLCPDSVRLISAKSTGLWSAYNSMKDIWRFDLYPFGNARRDPWNRLVCQHGTQECKGNLMHMCALKVLNQTQAFAVIDCLMDIPQLRAKAYSSMAQVDKPESWSYDNSVHAPTGSPTITDYKQQVAAPCWRKLHQPRWQALVEDCVNDGDTKESLENYYETETQRVNFSWVPAVFVNGTFNYKASHGMDLISFLT